MLAKKACSLRTIGREHLEDHTWTVKIMRLEQSRFEGELNNKVRDRDVFDVSLLLCKL